MPTPPRFTGRTQHGWLVMSRIVARFLTAVLLVCSGEASAEEAPIILYPSAVGSEWTYQNGQSRITERIAAYEPIAGESCAKLETVYEGKVVASEHIAFRPDGIYRTAIAGKPIEPAFLFLKLPPRHGDMWKVKSRIQGQELAGDFNALIGKVKVPAGEFQAFSVLGKNFRTGDKDLEFETVFAPGVGKVKHIVRIDGKETLLELISFKPGPATPAAPASAPKP